MKVAPRRLLALLAVAALALISVDLPRAYPQRARFRPPPYRPPVRIESFRPRFEPRPEPRPEFGRPEIGRPGFRPEEPWRQSTDPLKHLHEDLIRPRSVEELYRNIRQMEREAREAEAKEAAREQALIESLTRKAEMDPVGSLRELVSTSPPLRPSDPLLRGGFELTPREKLAFSILAGLESKTKELIESKPVGEDCHVCLVRIRALRKRLREAASLLNQAQEAWSDVWPEMARLSAVELKGLQKDLAAKEPTLRQLYMEHALKRVAEAAEREGWGAAGRKADDYLGKLADGEQPSRVLVDFPAVARRLHALDKVGEVTQPPTAREAVSLTTRELSALPRRLREAVRDLQEIIALEKALKVRWDKAPDVERLLEQVNVLRGHEGGDTLARRFYRELSVKAFLDGYPEQANQLLEAERSAFKDKPPTPKEKAEADALLRDLGALIAGEGKVETWPAQQAVADNPGKSGHPTRGPPPGVALVLPEPTRAGWRPPAKEGARIGLPPPLPETLHPVIVKHRQQTKEEHTSQYQRAEKYKKVFLHHAYHPGPPPASLPTLTSQLTGTDDDTTDEAVFLASVERLLGRPLTAEEKVVARSMLRRGSTAAALLIREASAKPSSTRPKPPPGR